MSADLERVPLTNTSGNSVGSGGRALSLNVRRLHNTLNQLLNEPEREQFIHCLNVYHAKRNVYDLVQTLKVILNTAGKRQLLPMLRLVIPRSDQLLFDQYTSEGLYLKTELLPDLRDGFGDEGDSTLHRFVTSIQEQTPLTSSSRPDTRFFGEVRKVTLTRSRSHEGLGFSIRGGSEHEIGIYVSLVEPGSAAEREGLRVGDQIVNVNDMVFDNVTHVEAVKVLKESKTLSMSVCSMGGIPGGHISNHVYSWVDPEGRNVSPPPVTQEQGHGMDEGMVNLNMDDGRSLGLMIRGGAEYGLGIYITGVDPGSAADAGALKVGDQILEVNGQSFVTISHDEAVHILKTGRHLLMKVRDVGRLPHARMVVDESKWICSQSIAETNATTNGGSVSHSTVNMGRQGSISACSSRPSSAKVTHVLGGQPVYRGVAPPGAQVSLEQQAYMLLTEPERQTMTYYLQEYQEGHIGAEPLTMALFELFNTHAKLSMLSEVRSLVAPQDLDLYDRLVLHRESETHQAGRGGLGVMHPQGPCNHSVPVMDDAGHSVPVMTYSTQGGWPQKDQEDNTNALQNVPLDVIQVPSGSPQFFRAAPLPGHSRPSREKEPSWKSSARRAQSGFFTSPTWLLQDCLHKSLKSLPSSHQPPSAHHTSLGNLHHTCPNSPQPSEHHLHHFHHCEPNSSHFLPHRDYPSSAGPETSVKLASRSSSYEKSSYLSKSASSSKAPSPMSSPLPSPHLSPCPSPCPSLHTHAGPLRRPCSPGLAHKVCITDMNRLSADSRPRQRGATLSQLSDSGQTLSEDSGVDIAETGGVSKDSSPRPRKNHLNQTGTAVPPMTRRQTGSPISVSTAQLVRVVKNGNTLGIAIEGGANTRQPLPRIVTIQKGGSAHSDGQLRVGQVILEVNGIPLRGREHKDAAQIIAEAFKTKDQDHIDFLVVEPGL